MKLPLYSLFFFSFFFLQAGENQPVANYGTIQVDRVERSDKLDLLEDKGKRLEDTAKGYQQESKGLHNQLNEQENEQYCCSCMCFCLDLPTVENFCDRLFGDSKE